MRREQSMTHNPVMEGTPRPTPDTPEPTTPPEDTRWLTMSRQTYQKSTRYFEEEHRDKWEHAINLFRGRHAPGSKYYSSDYAHRSRLFRPKTRSSLRRHEAAAAAAYFSTTDTVQVEPGNDADPGSRFTASLAHWMVNMRLRRTIPWFTTLIGAYQNTMSQGAVASKVHWEYEEITTPATETITDEFTHSTETVTTHTTHVLKDQPRIELIPLENLRFDPDCDWTDPAGTSPYLIHMIPMYAGDVIRKQGWNNPSLEEVLTYGQAHIHEKTTKRVRRGERSRDTVIEGNEFSQVWVREYHMNVDGDTLVWHTLGDDMILSDPTPRAEVYLHGNPFRIGYSMIEAFNPLPDSLAYLSRDLQAKANDVDNQRFDNVRLVLNKRYFIRRGAKINTAQLYRSLPGGSVTMNDPNQDIRWDETRDVTGSAYAEQQRVDADFDELAGSFSQAQMMQNKDAPVGNMRMMNAQADSVTEYQLKVFAETWVEPVLNQLAHCILKYETDDETLQLAGLDARWDDIPAQLLENEIILTVDVGMGATDPMQRVGRFLSGLDAIARVPNIAQRIKEDEVIKEVFGRLGFKDGMRFFNSEEEMRAQQEAQQHPQVIAENIKAQNAEADRQFRMAELDKRLAAQAHIAMMEASIKYNISMEQLTQRLRDAQQARVDTAKVELSKQAMKDRTHQREVELKQLMGSGI